MGRLISITVGRLGDGDRSDLVLGVDKPGPTNTGVLPGIARTTITGNVTLSGSATLQVYENVNLLGRMSITGPNIEVRNCVIRGADTANAIITASNAAAFNVKFIDCEIYPQFFRPETNGIAGHDVEFIRCDIHHVVDGIQISNAAYWDNLPVAERVPGWPCGVKFTQCWIHDLARWTASTGGIVHPSDTVTHNDGVQIFGGSGLSIRGCYINVLPALQYGHLYLQREDGYIYTVEEAEALPDSGPFISVPLGSLPNGGPYQAPWQGNGTGLKSRGELSSTDFAGVLTNNSQGYVSDIIFEDNWCEGGEFFWNGGGNPNPGGGVNLGSFRRNKFKHNQGNQGSGGDNTYTLAFLGSWSGNVTAPTVGIDRNYYDDNNAAITVRT